MSNYIYVRTILGEPRQLNKIIKARHFVHINQAIIYLHRQQLQIKAVQRIRAYNWLYLRMILPSWSFSTYEPNQSGPKKWSPLTEPLSHVQLYIGRAKTTQDKENQVSRWSKYILRMRKSWQKLTKPDKSEQFGVRASLTTIQYGLKFKIYCSTYLRLSNLSTR